MKLITSSMALTLLTAMPLSQAANLDLKGSHAIGKYAAGCQYKSVGLSRDGGGFQTMKLSRKRYYGQPDLIDYLQKLAKKIRDAGMDDILIGDLAKRKGGPMPYGHNSHQNGLDVDIWFRQAPKGKRYTNRERERLIAWDYVTERNRKFILSKAWTAKKDKLMKLSAEDPRVARIFVNPAIKQRLCQKFPGAPWLQKIRPWWNHRDHLHVRLICPKGAKHCISQVPVRPGTGCGSDLAWWFSEEAWKIREDFRKNPVPRKKPKLPALCSKVFRKMEDIL